MSKLIDERLAELESMDESVKFKHLLRRDWPKDLIKHKTLLWQVPRSTGKFLHLLTKIKQPKLILELGTSGGYSALWMLRSTNAHLHTIEFSDYRFNIAKTSFEKTNLTSRVTQHLGKIKPVLDSWTEKLDFVFIDADKIAYLDNFTLIEPHLNKGAIVVVDNILDSLAKTQCLVDYVNTNDNFSCDVLEMDNGLLVAIKN
jgi:predicted O-methyltransferase YrrM